MPASVPLKDQRLFQCSVPKQRIIFLELTVIILNSGLLVPCPLGPSLVKRIILWMWNGEESNVLGKRYYKMPEKAKFKCLTWMSRLERKAGESGRGLSTW